MKIPITISFVIPCKNEVINITSCLNSVIREGKKFEKFEIILIDNGSTDGTQKIVESYGDQIIQKVVKDVTISELRNVGAKLARYDWLAFIDADVELQDCWANGLHAVVMGRREAEDGYGYRIVTGSTYKNPENATWVQQAWYLQLQARDKEQHKYINGGNLIIERSFFEKSGGFDPQLKTGEDVQFCTTVLNNGGKILKDDSIGATHHGYPPDVSSFFLRERWHGLGMAMFLWTPWRSRDILLALYNIFLIPIMVGTAYFSHNFVLTLCSFLGLTISPVVPMAISRSKSKKLYLFPLLFLYLVYGYARSYSVLIIIFNLIKNK